MPTIPPPPFQANELLTAERLNGLVQWLVARIDLGRSLGGEPGWLRRPDEAGWNTAHALAVVDSSVPRKVAVCVQHLRVVCPRSGAVLEVEAPSQFVVDLPRQAGNNLLLFLQRGSDGLPTVTAAADDDAVPIARLVEVAGAWRVDAEWLPPAASVAGSAQVQQRLAAIVARLHAAVVEPGEHVAAEAVRVTVFAAWFGALGDGEARPCRYFAAGRELLAELGRLTGWPLPPQGEPPPWRQGLGHAVAEWAKATESFLQHWSRQRRPKQALLEVHAAPNVGEFLCVELRAQPDLGAACSRDGVLRAVVPVDLPDGGAEVRLSADRSSPLAYVHVDRGFVRDGVLVLDVRVPTAVLARASAVLWVVPSP